MEFGLLTIGFLVVAAVLLLLAVKLLLQPDWLLGFLIGFSACFLLSLAAVIVGSALNIATFQSVSSGQSLGSLSIQSKADGTQQYDVELALSNSDEAQTFIMAGDTWRLSIVELSVFGQQYYKITEVDAQYYSLEQNKPMRQLAQHASTGIDLAYWLAGKKLGFIASRQYKTSAVAFNAGSISTVKLKGDAVEVVTINEAATPVAD